MEKNGWKMIAWSFIILFTIETAGIVYLLNLGNETMKKEDICSNNICYDLDSTGYYFDTVNSMCYCYNQDELISKRYLE